MDGDVAVLDCLLEIRAFNPDLLAALEDTQLSEPGPLG